VAAVLGVKDEVELIGASIAHLRRIGVGHIAVADYGSTDGTLDVVSDELAAGDVSLTHVDPDHVVDYATASAHDLALAQATGAEWVILLDADEFWIPASGSLRDCAALGQADVVTVDRFNVAVTPHHLLMPADLCPRHYGSLQVLTRRVPDFKAFVEQHPLEPFVTVVPGPKVVARRAVMRGVTPGGHDVLHEPRAARRTVAADLIVAHVAFSSFGRFERKVANIRGELARHPRLFEGTCAWHWRRWAEMTTPGAIEAEFTRQVATRARLEHWRRLGHLRTADELLTARLGRALPSADAAGAAWDFSPTSALCPTGESRASVA
jgi:glycosyltransferase involved in cell wall biosynthesis